MLALSSKNFNVLLRYKSRQLQWYTTERNRLVWPSYEIRNKFIEYYCVKNDHKFQPSSSVLPKKGSGTYFTNSGMNQFKSIILGEVNANEIIDASKYTGVANSQKCIRIGGKHSDLEEIGKDNYHHTFFEMLGKIFNNFLIWIYVTFAGFLNTCVSFIYLLSPNLIYLLN